MGKERKFFYTVVSIVLAAVILIGSIMISHFSVPVYAETETGVQQITNENTEDHSEDTVVSEDTDAVFMVSGEENTQENHEDTQEEENNNDTNMSAESQDSFDDHSESQVQNDSGQTETTADTQAETTGDVQTETEEVTNSEEITEENKEAESIEEKDAYQERVYSAVYLNYEYEDNGDGTITITKYNGTDSNIIIPSEIGGKKVVKIGDGAFAESKNIITVNIPSTVTEIGNCSFLNCEKLAAINWGGNEEKLGYEAFANTGIKELRLPSKIKEMVRKTSWDADLGSFSRCKSLKKVWIPKSVEKTWDTFAGCEALETIEFEEGRTEIPASIFWNCDGLKTVNIPNGIVKIGDSAFAECNNITTLNIPSTVTEIGNCSFLNCEKLAAINWGGNEEKLGYEAFANTGIKELRLPSKIKEMVRKTSWDADLGSFSRCKSLKKVWIPKSVEKTWDTFAGCEALDTIEFEEGRTEIPATIFYNCDGLIAIDIPDTVKVIGTSAFNSCDNLESVSLGQDTTTIGRDAFANDPKLSISCNYKSNPVIYLIDNGIPFYSNGKAFIDRDEYLLDKNRSLYYTSMESASISGAIMLKADYKLKGSQNNKATDKKLVFYIPKDSELVESSIKLDGNVVENYNYNAESETNRRLTIPVENSEGVVTFSVKLNSGEPITSYAYLSYKKDNKNEIEVINVVNEQFDAITVGCDEYTRTDNAKIYGIALPEADIDIYVDGEKVGNTKAKKNGSYEAAVKLNNPEENVYYVISVKSKNEKDEEVEATTRTTYDPGAPELKSIIVGYDTHGVNNKVEIFDTNGIKPLIYYAPSQEFTFEIQIDNNERVDEVFVTSTRNNVKKEMKATYNLESGKYEATGFFDKNDKRYVPGKIGIEFTTTEKKDSSINEKNVNKYVEEVEKYNEEHDVLKITETTDDTVKYEINIGQDTDSPNVVKGQITHEVKENISRNEYNSIVEELENTSQYVYQGSDGKNYYVTCDFSNQDKIASKITITYSDVFDTTVENIFIESVSQVADDAIQAFITGTTEASGMTVGAVAFLYDWYQTNKQYEESKQKIMQDDSIADKDARIRTLEQWRDYKMSVNFLLFAGACVLGAGAFMSPLSLVALSAFAGTVSDLYFENKLRNILNGGCSVKWAVDPSGFIYDVNTGERLEDVTVSAYWIPYDESDDFWDQKPSEIEYGTLWDSFEYEQENPLLSNVDGKYAWDVPEGWWRVKVEKEGYGTVWSEWVPVPPIQTDVNIGMQGTKISLDKTLLVLDKGKSGKITATVKPDDLADKTVTWSSSDTGVAKVDKNGNVTAINHGTAKITAKTSNGKTATCEVRVSFIDVTNAKEWYYKPVYWAAEKGITTGTDGKFFPADSCTREQAVTFLWRMAGKPNPKSMVSKYSDVKDTKRYSYKAIMWGTEKGVITGTDGKFYPTGTCTREQIVTMIWRLAGKPAPKNMNSKFKDVTSKTRYSYKAVMWAAEKGITTGTNGLFYPAGQCKRREIVTFIYRYKN